MARPRLQRPRGKLVQRPGSPKWYISWTDAGQSRRVSTGTADRRGAEIILAEWERALDAPPAPEHRTMGWILDRYLEDRQGVVVAYSRLQEAALPLKAFFGAKPPDHLDRSLVRAYGRSRGVSDGTLGRELSVLRAALRLAEREGWIDRAPAIQLPPRPAPRERWLSREEALRLRYHARYERHRTSDGLWAWKHAWGYPHIYVFIRIALATGARKGAILDLTWDRVDLERRTILLAVPGRRQTKKRRPGVPISPKLYVVLCRAEAMRTTNYVIEYNGGSVQSVKKAFRKARDAAGLGPDVTEHVLRHTVATVAGDGRGEAGADRRPAGGRSRDGVSGLSEISAGPPAEYGGEAVRRQWGLICHLADLRFRRFPLSL